MAVAMLGFLVVTRRKRGDGKRRPKIAVIGCWGDNIGDEAMLHADLQNLRFAVPHLDIVIISPRPAHTIARHGERSVEHLQEFSCRRGAPRTSKVKTAMAWTLFLVGALAERWGWRMRLWEQGRTLLDELATADLLFSIGGANLNSLAPSELHRRCTTFLAARILRKPVILSGQTIGPLTKWYHRLGAAVCLNRVHMITLRDKGASRERLREIGVSRPIMADTADDAMTLPALPRDAALRLLQENVPDAWRRLPARLMVAMNLKGAMWVYKDAGQERSLSKEVALLASLADRLVERHDAKVLFVPTAYSPRQLDDRVRHQQVVSRMQRPDRAACIEAELDDVSLKALIGLADVAIGCRYHFCVFAAAEQVPFVGMASGTYQLTKVRGLADLCGVPECFVPEDMESAAVEDVWARVEGVLARSEQIRGILAREVPLLRRRSLTAIEEAVRLLQAAGHGPAPDGVAAPNEDHRGRT